MGITRKFLNTHCDYTTVFENHRKSRIQHINFRAKLANLRNDNNFRAKKKQIQNCSNIFRAKKLESKL